jgi:hypothetical protein
MTTKHSQQVYQLKITLKGAKPPIWRRVLVPADIRLDQFHDVIQGAMGWMNCHLHQFEAFGEFYGVPDGMFDLGPEVLDETKVKLNELLQSEKDSIAYDYDFGDDWAHKITLEKILPFEQGQSLPICVTGRRACPPEDCGGVWGYANLLQALADPKHPEHEDMLEWLGGPFDPEDFHPERTNAALHYLCTQP